jgi:hypothetical protein
MRMHSLWIGCLVVCVLSGATPAREQRAKVLLNPQFDPEADRVELFEALDGGLLNVEMKPRHERGGSLFVENLTDRSLTVELPAVLVGVQVLPQVGLQFQFPGGTGVNSNSQSLGRGQGQGQSQPVGGTPNGAATGSGIPNGAGNGNNNLPGFFSVPPERIARIEYSSVCLQHGAPEPRGGNTYQLVRVEQFSKDPRLAGVLRRVGRPGQDAEALQAAAWHVANGMTWDELSGKRRRHLNAASEPYFARSDVEIAREIVRQTEVQLAARSSPFSLYPAPTSPVLQVSSVKRSDESTCSAPQDSPK